MIGQKSEAKIDGHGSYLLDSFNLLRGHFNVDMTLIQRPNDRVGTKNDSQKGPVTGVTFWQIISHPFAVEFGSYYFV